MKLRILTLLLGVVVPALSVNGQDHFTFRNHLGDTVHIPINPGDIGSHFLGENIAIKYYRLKETYTYEESGTAASPVGQTVVTKPTIYYSLKKLNNHYKKQLKKGEIGQDVAARQLGWFFDVGFAIFEQDTDELEKALKSAKKPDEIAQIFANVKLE